MGAAPLRQKGAPFQWSAVLFGVHVLRLFPSPSLQPAYHWSCPTFNTAAALTPAHHTWKREMSRLSEVVYRENIREPAHVVELDHPQRKKNADGRENGFALWNSWA